MSGIQLPIGIDTVNPVDADYKKGPWPTVAAALAGIPVPLRYNNLTFYVVGDPNEYYWLDTDLTNTGLLTRNSGRSLPTVRYVYLVQDAADVTKMGGAPENVYNTFQTAYNAANTLQVSLGGTNVVYLKVIGILTGASASLTLTANFNPYVRIIGESSASSRIEDITLSNLTGNGYNFGNTLPIYISNITIRNIFCGSGSLTGSSGNINIDIENSKIGNLNAATTNVLNLTGSPGNITVTSNSASTSFIGDINNGILPASTGKPKSLSITSVGRIKCGNINSSGVGTSTGLETTTLINVDAGSINRHSKNNITINNCTSTGDIIINDLNVVPSFAVIISITNTSAVGGISVSAGLITTAVTALLTNTVSSSINITGINATLKHCNSYNLLGNALVLDDTDYVLLFQNIFDTTDYSGGLSSTITPIQIQGNPSFLAFISNTVMGGFNYGVESVNSVTIDSCGNFYAAGYNPLITLAVITPPNFT